ncbi:MAG: DDE-type integrase/transposase/recombinase, partial [Planctomycetes bacterium]|nr:DDE-type integrase/transposase/recombinase [Planctomycetota bacterium]
MAREPLRIAIFRFEQLAPLLEERLTPAERRLLVQAAARTPVLWPSGRHAPVPASTLYRWLQRYRAAPKLETLLQQPRPPSRKAPVITPEWLAFALALLEEEPARSLYLLGRKLQARFGLPKAPCRSSLHRALRRQARYTELRRRARGERRLRTRFQALQPHQIWQTDAKGKFWVRFADGATAQVCVLSLLDDATRFVVCGLVCLEETAAAAVRTFRRAAARYGLPLKIYPDRGSAYDSYVFRKGLALLGVHRIWTRPRNAPCRGKIEAYHRAMKRWFVQELKHQLVRDLAHLQELFDAWLEVIYHAHPHRELRRTPRQALDGRRSERLVSLERLRQAFLVERILTAHPKDATVRVEGTLFRVPARLVVGTRKVRVFVDPEAPGLPMLETAPGRYEPLPPAVQPTGPTPRPAGVASGDEPEGALTPLLEEYRGRILPLAQAGFGLPEIYEAFACRLGRPVPATEAEAASVVAWLGDAGPFEPRAFHAALARVCKRLGAGRPFTQVLSALAH